MKSSVKRLARARRLARFRRRVGSFFRAWNETYMKRINTAIILNAIAWVWCSYILAWFGRYEIAQQLSQTALTAILGVVFTYGLKSVTENVSKNGYVGRIGEAAPKVSGKKKRIFDIDDAA
jgi:hypothetical protein